MTGIGVVHTESTQDFRCVVYDVIRTSPKQDLSARLKIIYDGIAQAVDLYHPDHVAMEDIFYGRNVQAALKLGQARGAAIIAAINSGVPVSTYSAREVKMALTGYGAASKEQVQHMVKDLLNLEQLASPLDASDALAIALCHAQRCWSQKNYIIKL